MRVSDAFQSFQNIPGKVLLRNQIGREKQIEGSKISNVLSSTSKCGLLTQTWIKTSMILLKLDEIETLGI